MTDEYDAVDIFAGPGGWDVAADSLGLRVLGVELDDAACATRDAAGHATARGDVAALDPRDFAADGLIGSPPCPTFSAAGNGAGRLLVAVLLDCAKAMVDGRDTRAETWLAAYEILAPVTDAAARAKAKGPLTVKQDAKARARAERDAAMSVLVVEPIRWAMANGPEWIALEQVPPVLAIWRAFAALLETQGYRCWTGILEAERYGVPQTRERAILLARRDRQPHPPAPTHQRYVPGEAQRHDVTLEGDVLPWVSMAEALGWGMDERPSVTVMTPRGAGGPSHALSGHGKPDATINREHRRGAWTTRSVVMTEATPRPREAVRGLGEPAPTMMAVGGASRKSWQIVANAQANAAKREVAEPAPTITGGHDMANRQWVADRPSTNVNGDPRISAPGHHDPEQSGSQQEGAIRVTVQEAAILQGFPADYPWQGSRTAQFQQVGNAVPPPLARAILATLLGIDAEPARGGHPSEGDSWAHRRPATTVVGTRRSSDGMLIGRQMAEGEGRNIGGHGWNGEQDGR